VISMKLRFLAAASVLAMVLTPGCWRHSTPAAGSLTPTGPSSVPEGSASRSRSAPERPNLVLIMTDDQRADSLFAMSNVRRLLGKHGVTFTNSFVTTSYCCPSRVSTFTGQYSRHTGVLDNGGPNGGATVFRDDSTLATWLKSVGYATSFVGKYLNQYKRLMGGQYIPPGWDDWNAIIVPRYYDYTTNENGHLVHHGRSVSDYSTTYLANRAIDFIRNAPEPFFLYFAPHAPHAPPVPAPREPHAFEDLPLYQAPSANEPDVSDKPWHGLHPPLSTTVMGRLQDQRRKALATLLEVDRAVGAIIHALVVKGALKNTIMAFTSDNGLMWGEHRLRGKVWPYEESIRVPLIVRTPWEDRPGRYDSHLVLNIDLAATFSELAGVPPGLLQDGLSLVPLLRNVHVRSWRDAFVVEFLGTDQRSIRGPPRFRGIRTSRYLYIEYEIGWRELYDLRRDPHELQNLAGLPSAQHLQASLSQELSALLVEPAR
jgi:N-acetylglucosamine-6-sulfatase